MSAAGDAEHQRSDSTPGSDYIKCDSFAHDPRLDHEHEQPCSVAVKRVIVVVAIVSRMPMVW